MLMSFIIIGAIGLALAVLATLAPGWLDRHIEADFARDGVLSTSSLAATLAGFGLGGAAAMTVFGVEGTGLALTIAVGVGLLGWLGNYVTSRALTRRREGPPEKGSWRDARS